MTPIPRYSLDTGETDVTAEQANKLVPDLMGAREVAAELGVSPSNLGKVADLPPPAKELIRGRLWRADVIYQFAQRREDAMG